MNEVVTLKSIHGKYNKKINCQDACVLETRLGVDIIHQNQTIPVLRERFICYSFLKPDRIVAAPRQTHHTGHDPVDLCGRIFIRVRGCISSALFHWRHIVL